MKPFDSIRFVKDRSFDSLQLSYAHAYLRTLH